MEIGWRIVYHLLVSWHMELWAKTPVQGERFEVT